MSASGVREGLTEEVSLELTWKEGQGDWQVGGGAAHISSVRGLGWVMPEV